MNPSSVACEPLGMSMDSRLNGDVRFYPIYGAFAPRKTHKALQKHAPRGGTHITTSGFDIRQAIFIFSQIPRSWLVVCFVI